MVDQIWKVECKEDWLPRLVIRNVQATDLTALEWEGEYSHFRRIYADAFERAKSGLSVLWLAEISDSMLIGQAFIQLICDRPELADGKVRAYLYGFRVRPAYRGCGVGSLMMDAIEIDLRRRRFHWLTLNVARENIRARALYERRGYKVIAPEPGLWSYSDEKGIWHTMEEPAWRMEKFLG
jgi:ribosomal protein S18 acetylase RimI-like enzyme